MRYFSRDSFSFPQVLIFSKICSQDSFTTSQIFSLISPWAFLALYQVFLLKFILGSYWVLPESFQGFLQNYFCVILSLILPGFPLGIYPDISLGISLQICLIMHHGSFQGFFKGFLPEFLPRFFRAFMRNSFNNSSIDTCLNLVLYFYVISFKNFSYDQHRNSLFRYFTGIISVIDVFQDSFCHIFKNSSRDSFRNFS